MPKDIKAVHTGPFQTRSASGVRYGDFVTFSGQVSLDEDDDIIGEGDIVLQIRQCYTNLMQAMSELGVTADNIIDETWFVLDMQETILQSEDLVEVREELLGRSLQYVSHTIVEVSGLVYPELLIEVKCIAHL